MRAENRWIQRLARLIPQFILTLFMGSILFVNHAAAADTRKALANPSPEYPEIARRMNINGVVKVELEISADGTIKSAKILGGHPVLADAVQKALKRWKYAPASSDTTLQVEFRF